MPEAHEQTYSEAQFLQVVSLITKTAEMERRLHANGNGDSKMPWRQLAIGAVVIIVSVIAFMGKELYEIRGVQSFRGGYVSKIQPMDDAIHALERDAGVLRQKVEENERAINRLYEAIRQNNRLP